MKMYEYAVSIHYIYLIEAILMSTTTYILVEKLGKIIPKLPMFLSFFVLHQSPIPWASINYIFAQVHRFSPNAYI